MNKTLSVMDCDDLYACDEEELLDLCEAHGVIYNDVANYVSPWREVAIIERLDRIRHEMIMAKREQQSEGMER
mgnify:CR=1 FL=1